MVSRLNLESHKREAIIENARFLLDTAKLHPDRVARRLGMNREAFDKMMDRSEGGKPDTPAVEGLGAAPGEEPVPALRSAG